MSRRGFVPLAVVPAALITLGCSKGAERRPDTATAPPAIGGANANPVDTGLAVRTPDTATARHDTSHAAPQTP